MELLLFYSPLEQFEFTLISGKLIPKTELYIYDLLATQEKNLSYADIDSITGTSFHKDIITAIVKESENYAHNSNSIMKYIMYLTYGFSPFMVESTDTIESKIAGMLNENVIYAKNNYDVYIKNAIDANLNIKHLGTDENLDILFKSAINGPLLNEIDEISRGVISYLDNGLLLNNLNFMPWEFVTFLCDMKVNIDLMTKRDYSAISFYWLNIYNSLFIVITLIILIFIIFNQGYTKVSNVWQILNTLTFDFLLKSFISLANKNLLAFFPIFFCFFIFIYFLNLTALTPFSFCVTSNLWFSLSLSFSVWFGVTALAIIVRGKTFFTGFVPSNISSNELKAFITVIEVISYVARALSLGVRIFANMLAGHSLVHILSDLTATCFVEFDNIGLKIFGIFPAIILSFILVIEFGICFLQGLVFVILTAIYLKEAFEGH